MPFYSIKMSVIHEQFYCAITKLRNKLLESVIEKYVFRFFRIFVI